MKTTNVFKSGPVLGKCVYDYCINCTMKQQNVIANSILYLFTFTTSLHYVNIHQIGT